MALRCTLPYSLLSVLSSLVRLCCIPAVSRFLQKWIGYSICKVLKIHSFTIWTTYIYSFLYFTCNCKLALWEIVPVRWLTDLLKLWINNSVPELGRESSVILEIWVHGMWYSQVQDTMRGTLVCDTVRSIWTWAVVYKNANIYIFHQNNSIVWNKGHPTNNIYCAEMPSVQQVIGLL